MNSVYGPNILRENSTWNTYP